MYIYLYVFVYNLIIFRTINVVINKIIVIFHCKL